MMRKSHIFTYNSQYAVNKRFCEGFLLKDAICYNDGLSLHPISETGHR